MPKISKIVPSEQLPVEEQQRESTDCWCTVIGAIFAISIFILATLIWNQYKIIGIINQISGHQRQQCAKGEYIYYQNALQFYKGTCVNKCPSNLEGSSVEICIPVSNTPDQLYWKSKLVKTIYKHEGFVQTIIYTFIIALGYGMLRMAVIQWMPRYVPIMSYVLGALLLLVFAAITFFTPWIYEYLGKWNLAFGVFLIILALILIVMLCMYSHQLKFQGYMLEYSVAFLEHNCLTFIYVPLFLILHSLLVALVFWQHICFSSQFMKNISVWRLTFSQVLDIIVLIEYLWGLQFLRDAFNFCVSGNAVDWYWTGRASCGSSWERLIWKHWGSVVGGSFLNCFFQVPTLIAQLIVCHPETCCSSLGNLCYNKLNIIPCFFELVRTDAYSFINLTGLPFCESARRCSKLCQKSNHFVGYHSAMKHHRLGAHIASISFITIWACWILVNRVTDFQWQQQFLVLIFVIYGTVTWFIGIHVDAAQGLQTCYLVEFQLQGDYQYMRHLLPSVRKILQPIQNRVQGDGNC